MKSGDLAEVIPLWDCYMSVTLISSKHRDIGTCNLLALVQGYGDRVVFV